MRIISALPYEKIDTIAHPDIAGVTGKVRLTSDTEDAFRIGDEVFAKRGSNPNYLVDIWEFDSLESEAEYLASLIRGRTPAENITLSREILERYQGAWPAKSRLERLEAVKKAIVDDYKLLVQKEKEIIKLSGEVITIRAEEETLKEQLIEVQIRLKEERERLEITRNDIDVEKQMLDDINNQIKEKNAELEVLRAPIKEQEQQVGRDWWREAQQFDNEAEALQHAFTKLGDRVQPYQVVALHLALKYAPFTVLAGPSGAGKTSFVLEYAEAVGMQQTLIAVQPNWTGVHNLHGYINPLQGAEYRGTPFSEALRYQVEYAEVGECDAPLDLVLLDEINLAYVEYFLADYLSAFETAGRKVQLVTADEASNLKPAGDEMRSEDKHAWLYRNAGQVAVPSSFLIAGTANEDHTTRPFSDKFRDRAAFLHLAPPDVDTVFGLKKSASSLASLEQASEESKEAGRLENPNANERKRYIARARWDEWLKAPQATETQRRQVADLAHAVENAGFSFSVRSFQRALTIFSNFERLKTVLTQQGLEDVSGLDLAASITIVPKYKALLTGRKEKEELRKKLLAALSGPLSHQLLEN